MAGLLLLPTFILHINYPGFFLVGVMHSVRLDVRTKKRTLETI